MLLRDPDLFARPLAEGLGGIAEPFKRPSDCHPDEAVKGA
jgi:hypothetical protein